SSNGPDLRVYLSREMLPVDFIDLGALKATGGNQVYEIPGTPDLSQYKYALVHCRRYNHLFGWALLQ
ncbi:MAG TPA: DM13 domain-containing protein, partial [Ferruginibacter sp.]|nr:DM13 domain-containing protein [Ferruginibacter sp.]